MAGKLGPMVSGAIHHREWTRTPDVDGGDLSEAVERSLESTHRRFPAGDPHRSFRDAGALRSRNQATRRDRQRSRTRPRGVQALGQPPQGLAPFGWVREGQPPGDGFGKAMAGRGKGQRPAAEGRMIPEGTSWNDGADAGHRPDLVVRDHGRSDPTPRTPDTRSTLHASTGPRAKVANLHQIGRASCRVRV